MFPLKQSLSLNKKSGERGGERNEGQALLLGRGSASKLMVARGSSAAVHKYYLQRLRSYKKKINEIKQ